MVLGIEFPDSASFYRHEIFGIPIHFIYSFHSFHSFYIMYLIYIIKSRFILSLLDNLFRDGREESELENT